MAVHDDLVAVVRKFAERELLPRTALLDSGTGLAASSIAAVWQRLTELDLDRALLAEELGGVGLDTEAFLRVLEEVAVGDAGVALVALLNNAALASLPAEVTKSLPAGTRWTVAFAPVAAESIGASVDLIRDDGSVYLTGRLAAVFGAVGADGIVVAAREPAPSIFAVPAGVPGLTISPDPLQMGLRAARAADLTFDRVAVSVAPGPRATTIESRTRALVNFGVAAISRGIARRGQQIALAYAQTRIQGGVPLVEHGAVSDMLAAMAVRLQACAASRLAVAAEDPKAALAHRIAASDAAMATTTDAVQVLGGIGYMIDSGVEKLMRDAKYCQLYPERNWVAGGELIRPEGVSR